MSLLEEKNAELKLTYDVRRIRKENEGKHISVVWEILKSELPDVHQYAIVAELERQLIQAQFEEG